ncbi:hypothetical protein, partial [Henriciella sp.]|uniref:hypothetical protein n=1 Tax=Henriciella sp. TaxID=1968823 RepID=UPI000C10D886
MADIFDEVEEGLRQDRAARLWKKYGVFAYIAAALLIGGVALNEYMQSQRAQNLEEQGAAFESADEALSEQNFEQAGDEFAALAQSDNEIAPLAANYLAAARLAGNADRAAAVDALEMAANAETPIGKLSLMKAAYLKAGETSRAEMETYLGSLMDEESEFGALALELVASMAVQEGDVEYARQVFNELRFLANVPQGVQQRARIALDALPVTAASQDEAEQPAPTNIPGLHLSEQLPKLRSCADKFSLIRSM